MPGKHSDHNLNFFGGKTKKTNFRWCWWGAERRVKRAQTQERGPPSAPAEITNQNTSILSYLLHIFPIAWLCPDSLHFSRISSIHRSQLLRCLVLVHTSRQNISQTWKIWLKDKSMRLFRSCWPHFPVAMVSICYLKLKIESKELDKGAPVLFVCLVRIM